MHVCVRARAYLCAQAFGRRANESHAGVCGNVHARVHVCVCASVCVYRRACLWACVCECMCVCVYVLVGLRGCCIMGRWVCARISNVELTSALLLLNI